MIVLLTVQATGAVNKLLTVKVQVAFAEKFAVVFTTAPFAVKPVKVTVCGLDVMAKVCPFTFNVPVVGAFVYVTVTCCV